MNDKQYLLKSWTGKLWGCIQMNKMRRNDFEKISTKATCYKGTESGCYMGQEHNSKSVLKMQI